MTKRFNHYLGKAGHLAIMSEFLMRGWNVAIPEVDIGDDIFVVQDEDGTLRRVQVKTSSTKAQKTTKSITAQFQIPLKQLQSLSNIYIHYIFISRNKDKWTQPVIIRQDYLLDHYQNDNIGSKYKDKLNLNFKYTGSKVECSKQNFTKYKKDYSDFPIVSH